MQHNTPVLCSASEHPVGLISAFSDQIINEYTNVRLISANNEGLSLLHFQACISPCYYALCCCLFVASSAADLCT
jgi:hypothetical protein